MRLKKLGAALVVVAALAAVLASSALAAAVTEDARWYTGSGTGAELSGSETVSATAIGNGTFTTTVSGTKYVLESTGVKCVECKIENSGGAGVGSGKLTFTGIKVVEPAGCSVASEVTTTALTWTAGWMIGSANYIKFVPTAGETFATINITGCALETSLVPKGSMFVQGQNATFFEAVEQEVHSSEAINSTAGGSLKVGTEPAVLKADAEFAMSGSKAGTAFGTHGPAAKEPVGWYTGSEGGTELSGSETMSAEAVGSAKFTTTVAGSKYKLEATGVKCVGCKIEVSGGDAVGSGKLTFTGVKVVEPANCSVATEITTKALTWTGGWMINSANYIKFVPTAGEVTTFATIEITGCAFATTINPKGDVFVQSQNATNIQAVEQEMHSSAAINAAAGGNLHVGEEAAALESNVKFKMSGAKAGQAFGTH